MLQVTLKEGRVHVGDRFSLSFQRTLRIPDDGKQYPLPPGLGRFPVHSVAHFADRVPQAWQGENALFIPMYQREALWLGFDGAVWKPNAVKIGVGRVNAITGEEWDKGLNAEPQNYIVTPLQPWLDGIKVGEGIIRQFVAMPLGLGYTIEAQVSGKEEFGGIQVIVYEPKPGRFPEHAPPEQKGRPGGKPQRGMISTMGLGAGGQMKQKIYPDPYGVDSWDSDNFGSVIAYIVNTDQYREITGLEPPPSPINAKTYTEFGLPWFDLYDEEMGDIAASEKLKRIRSIRDLDQEKCVSMQQGEESINFKESTIRKLHPLSSMKKKKVD